MDKLNPTITTLKSLVGAHQHHLVTEDAVLSDLLPSQDMLHGLAVRLETDFGLAEFSEETILRWGTVADVIASVERRQAMNSLQALGQEMGVVEPDITGMQQRMSDARRRAACLWKMWRRHQASPRAMFGNWKRVEAATLLSAQCGAFPAPSQSPRHGFSGLPLIRPLSIRWRSKSPRSSIAGSRKPPMTTNTRAR
jgi:hypothetical protein